MLHEGKRVVEQVKRSKAIFGAYKTQSTRQTKTWVDDEVAVAVAIRRFEETWRGGGGYGRGRRLQRRHERHQEQETCRRRPAAQKLRCATTRGYIGGGEE